MGLAWPGANVAPKTGSVSTGCHKNAALKMSSCWDPLLYRKCKDDGWLGVTSVFSPPNKG